MATTDGAFANQFKADAQKWVEGGKAAAQLYQGEQLRLARAYARESVLTPEEWDFVEEGIAVEHQEAASTFFRSMLFDVATLVTGVQGYLQLINRKEIGSLNERQTEYLDRVQRLIKRMRWWRGDFVRFLNHEYKAGHVTAHLHPTDPADLVDTVFETVCELFPDYGERLTKEVAGGLPHVTTDADRLQDTLIRLLAGIIPKVQTMTLRVRKSESGVQFEIGLEADYHLDWIGQALDHPGHPEQIVEMNLLYLKNLLAAHGTPLTFESADPTRGTLRFALAVA